MSKKFIVSIIAGAGLMLTLAACSTGGDTRDNSDKMLKARNNKIGNITLCGEKGESLECRNLAEKKKRDEDPTRISYVYELSWTGEFIGYYVIKGKVSSNQSQMGPADQFLDPCDRAGEDCWQAVEAPGDDGSFGPNEDGIFFFTTDGNKITWNGMYQQSDRLLAIKVPLLYEPTK